MWIYQKKLQYPVKITRPNPALAKLIAAQYGGPHGEMGASIRYLSQRYVMPNPELKAILTDIGTEELGHLEMVGAIVYQLTRNLTPEQIKEGGYDAYFIDHTTGIYPVDASGVPFTAAALDSTGDPLADIHEDLAAEQKARLTYDNILRFCTTDPEVQDAIRFLRAREVVHYQRFGEGLRIATDSLNAKNFYAFNPAFDKMPSATMNSAVGGTSTKSAVSAAEKPAMPSGTMNSAVGGTSAKSAVSAAEKPAMPSGTMNSAVGGTSAKSAVSAAEKPASPSGTMNSAVGGTSTKSAVSAAEKPAPPSGTMNSAVGGTSTKSAVSAAEKPAMPSGTMKSAAGAAKGSAYGMWTEK